MVRTKQIKYQKRKIYRRKTRGGQMPSHLKGKRLPNPHLISKSLPLLPEVPNPSPEHSPIHVSPHPPSPLFRRPSHTPPTSENPGFSRRAKIPGNRRRTKTAKLNAELKQFEPEQNYSPIHVLPRPPPPLFRRHSHSPSPPTSENPGFSRRQKTPGNLRLTKTAKLNRTLEQLAQQQKGISAIFARDSNVFNEAPLDEYLESD